MGVYGVGTYVVWDTYRGLMKGRVIGHVVFDTSVVRRKFEDYEEPGSVAAVLFGSEVKFVVESALSLGDEEEWMP